MCEYTAVAEGECCPRCVADPCLADNLSYDIRQTCQDPAGAVRLSGDTWHMPNSPCTTCKCKVGQRNNNPNEGLLYCAASVFDFTIQTSTNNSQQIILFYSFNLISSESVHSQFACFWSARVLVPHLLDVIPANRALYVLFWYTHLMQLPKLDSVHVHLRTSTMLQIMVGIAGCWYWRKFLEEETVIVSLSDVFD